MASNSPPKKTNSPKKTASSGQNAGTVGVIDRAAREMAQANDTVNAFLGVGRIPNWMVAGGNASRNPIVPSNPVTRAPSSHQRRKLPPAPKRSVRSVIPQKRTSSIAEATASATTAATVPALGTPIPVQQSPEILNSATVPNTADGPSVMTSTTHPMSAAPTLSNSAAASLPSPAPTVSPEMNRANPEGARENEGIIDAPLDQETINARKRRKLSDGFSVRKESRSLTSTAATAARVPIPLPSPQSDSAGTSPNFGDNYEPVINLTGDGEPSLSSTGASQMPAPAPVSSVSGVTQSAVSLSIGQPPVSQYQTVHGRSSAQRAADNGHNNPIPPSTHAGQVPPPAAFMVHHDLAQRVMGGGAHHSQQQVRGQSAVAPHRLSPFDMLWGNLESYVKNWASELDSSRLILLMEAIERVDWVFMLAHQAVCWSFHDRNLLATKFGNNLTGINLLIDLTGGRTALFSPKYLEFFSNFPLNKDHDWETSPFYKRAEHPLRYFLQNGYEIFTRIRSNCADEIARGGQNGSEIVLPTPKTLSEYGINSITIQKLVFTSIRRSLVPDGGPQTDALDNKFDASIVQAFGNPPELSVNSAACKRQIKAMLAQKSGRAAVSPTARTAYGLPPQTPPGVTNLLSQLQSMQPHIRISCLQQLQQINPHLHQYMQQTYPHLFQIMPKPHPVTMQMSPAIVPGHPAIVPSHPATMQPIQQAASHSQMRVQQAMMPHQPPLAPNTGQFTGPLSPLAPQQASQPMAMHQVQPLQQQQLQAQQQQSMAARRGSLPSAQHMPTATRANARRRPTPLAFPGVPVNVPPQWMNGQSLPGSPMGSPMLIQSPMGQGHMLVGQNMSAPQQNRIGPNTPRGSVSINAHQQPQLARASSSRQSTGQVPPRALVQAPQLAEQQQYMQAEARALMRGSTLPIQHASFDSITGTYSTVMDSEGLVVFPEIFLFFGKLETMNDVKFDVEPKYIETLCPLRKGSEITIPGQDVAVRKIFERGAVVRLKMVRVKAGADAPNEAEFSLADTTWPSGSFYVQLNGKSIEVQRKKDHWPKDWPRDLTPHVDSKNVLKMSYIPNTEHKQEFDYYFRIELLVACKINTVVDLLVNSERKLSLEDAREKLYRRLQATGDDVIVSTNSLSVPLTCPYDFNLIKIPARTQDCQHPECFDLKNHYMSNWVTKDKDPAKMPPWRCPLCGADARPQKLILDQLFDARIKEVRAKGKNVKSMTIYADGRYELIQEEVKKPKAKEVEIICLDDD